MVLSIIVVVGLFLCRLPLAPFGAVKEGMILGAFQTLVFVNAGGVVAGPVIVVVEAIIGFGLRLFRGWASLVYYCG